MKARYGGTIGRTQGDRKLKDPGRGRDEERGGERGVPEVDSEHVRPLAAFEARGP